MPLRFAESEEDDQPAVPKRRVQRKGTRRAHLAPEAIDRSKIDEDSDSDDPFAEQMAALEPQAPPSLSPKRRQARSIRKHEVEHATVELVRLVQDAQARGLVVNPYVALEAPGACGCATGCCAGLRAAMGLGAAPKHKKKKNKRQARGTYQVANLWKLNASVAPEGDNLRQLKSWRRRLCVLLEPAEADGDIVIVYISEKNNGQVHLAAMLGHPGEAIATVEELPKVELINLGRETKNWAVGSQKQYEIAFFAVGGLTPDEDWDEEVPNELYPFSVSWTDAAGARHVAVLASQKEEQRRRWVDQIQRDLRMLDTARTGEVK